MMRTLLIMMNITLMIYGWNHIHTDSGQLIITGEFLNTIQFVSNDFKMPQFVSFEQGNQLQQYQNDGFHTIGNSKTNFKFLCDWLVTPIGVFSPGDVMIGYGIGLQLFNHGNYK